MAAEVPNTPKLTTVHPVSVDTIITNNKQVTPRLASQHLHIDLPPTTTLTHQSSLSSTRSSTSSMSAQPSSTPPSATSSNHLQWEIDLEALLPCYASMLAESSIELVSNAQHWNAVLHMIMQREQRDIVGYKVLGFSAECKQVSSDALASVAVLQLAFSTTTVVLQLSLLDSIPDTLKALLENSGIVKIGVGIQHVADLLKSTHDITLHGAVDLAAIVNAVESRESSTHEAKQCDISESQQNATSHYTLQSICQRVLNVHLDSGDIVRRQDWDVNALTRRQVLYAASDAYFSRKALLHLYQRCQPHSSLINLGQTHTSQIGPAVSTLHQMSPCIENTRTISRRSSASTSGNLTHSPRHASISPAPLSRRSSSSSVYTDTQSQASPSLTRSPSPLTVQNNKLHVTSPLPSASTRSPLRVSTFKPLHTHMNQLSLSGYAALEQQQPSVTLSAENIRQHELQQFIDWLDNMAKHEKQSATTT